jgi:RHS repeat-associated protein
VGCSQSARRGHRRHARSEYTYDGVQRRVRVVEKENGVIQSDSKVVWCHREICEERAADGTTVTRRTFGQGEQESGVNRYFAADHLGSITEVTNGPGALLARYAFDPWGGRTLSSGTDITTVGFTGHRWQSSGSGWLTQYRFFDPATARWTSEDPLGLKEGPNHYAYVANNPLNTVDPDGRAAAAAAVVIGVCTAATAGACGAAAAAATIVTTAVIVSYLYLTQEKCNEREIRKANCYTKYLEDSAWCGGAFTDDFTYDKCMKWAWNNYFRCLNDVPPTSF